MVSTFVRVQLLPRRDSPTAATPWIRGWPSLLRLFHLLFCTVGPGHHRTLLPGEFADSSQRVWRHPHFLSWVRSRGVGGACGLKRMPLRRETMQFFIPSLFQRQFALPFASFVEGLPVSAQYPARGNNVFGYSCWTQPNCEGYFLPPIGTYVISPLAYLMPPTLPLRPPPISACP
jgi:hypothetical protein